MLDRVSIKKLTKADLIIKPSILNMPVKHACCQLFTECNVIGVPNFNIQFGAQAALLASAKEARTLLIARFGAC